MSIDQINEYLLIVVAVWFIGKMFMFYSLWDLGNHETPKDKRTPFGRALRGVLFWLSVTSFAIATTFLLRFAAGPNQPRIEHEFIALFLRLMLLFAMTAVTFYGVRLHTEMRERRRFGDEFVISNEGVFGTIAQAMPIIVADSVGIIQHTTPAFDELARSGPGELIGKDLKTIMPERYRGKHDGGMEHYVRTREARIVGTVVMVEMLRMDGTEVPVYLALNTTEVDGLPWFIASMWEKMAETPDTMVSDYERARSDRQDARDARQDEQQILLDETALVNTVRGKVLSVAGAELDGIRVTIDVDRQDQRDRSKRQDVREHEQEDIQRDQDQREIDQNERDDEPPQHPIGE